MFVNQLFLVKKKGCRGGAAFFASNKKKGVKNYVVCLNEYKCFTKDEL